jgi:hypothetical protein
VLSMSNFDNPVHRDDQVLKSVSGESVSGVEEDGPPARRLLAHDMEHLVWDDDGEPGPPPPD